MMRLLVVLAVLYVAAAVASLFTAFPFEAIAWTGLILILAFAWIDTKGVRDADRTREVVG